MTGTTSSRFKLGGSEHTRILYARFEGTGSRGVAAREGMQNAECREFRYRVHPTR